MVDSAASRINTAYVMLAYAISWVVGVPLALQKQGLMKQVLPFWTHYLVAYGPMLSALVVSFTTGGRQGVSEILRRMTFSNVRPLWWGMSISPLIAGIAVVLVWNFSGSERITLENLGEIHFLPPLGIGALFLWFVTFGLGEEVGWRGFLLPRLQKNRSAFAATVILSAVWAGWHLPQFFYLFDPAIAIGWGIGLFAGAIVFTWLFNSSGGSAMVVAVWHGCFNFMTASSAGNGMLAAIVSTVVMVWAVCVVLIFGTGNLSRHEKIVA